MGLGPSEIFALWKNPDVPSRWQVKENSCPYKMANDAAATGAPPAKKQAV